MRILLTLVWKIYQRREEGSMTLTYIKRRVVVYGIRRADCKAIVVLEVVGTPVGKRDGILGFMLE